MPLGEEMGIIFLTYLNRSGSTYLANLLSSSKDIIACPEAEILVNLFLEDPYGRYYPPEKNRREYLLSLLQTDPKLKFWNLDPEVLDQVNSSARNMDQFLNILVRYRDRIKPGAGILLFKAERLIHLVSNIMSEPVGINTSFIALVRDPRAVFDSQKRTVSPLNGKPMSTHPVNTAIQWREFARLCRGYEKLPGFNLVQFEDLILSGNEVMTRLCERLRLDPSSIKPGYGDLYERIPPDHRPIHESILKGPLPGKTGEWKQQLTRNETRLIEQTAGVKMSYYGYARIYPSRYLYLNIIRIIREILYFVVAWLRKAVYHFRKIYE